MAKKSMPPFMEKEGKGGSKKEKSGKTCSKCGQKC